MGGSSPPETRRRWRRPSAEPYRIRRASRTTASPAAPSSNASSRGRPAAWPLWRSIGVCSGRLAFPMTFPWRGSADRPLARLALPLTLVIAALLRLWALGQGVPFAVQVDEPEVLLRAVRMMRTGDLNPHFYDYPTLYMYLQAVVAALRFLIGAMRGEWAALAQA